MKKKVKKIIKEIIEKLNIDSIVKYHIMKKREKKYEKMSKKERIESLKKWYYKHTGEKLDLENPKGFNQKIQWIKINDFSEKKTILSDKYLVREWIKETIGEKYLVKQYNAWDNIGDIDFNSLPNQFVLKSNHGSAMNIVVKNKKSINYKKTLKKMKYWLKTPYDLSGLEEQYYAIPRKIIAEEYIEQEDGDLYDYKIHCFNGEPKLIQVIGERNLIKHTGKEAFFNTKWENDASMYRTYGTFLKIPKKPEKLNEMLEISKKLSKGFKYVRVDLYYVKGEIKFGEMTFTPASGIGHFSDKQHDLQLGEWIKL